MAAFGVYRTLATQNIRGCERLLSARSGRQDTKKNPAEKEFRRGPLHSQRDTSAVGRDAGILDLIIASRRNNDSIKQAAWEKSVTGIGWESYAIAIELNGHAPESTGAVSDTLTWDRTIRSEVDGLCDLPSAAWVCRGFERDIKVDDSTDWAEVDEYDIVFNSVD